MYYKARLKLTVIYTITIIVLFSLSSLLLYFWFSSRLGEGYITEVSKRHNQTSSSDTFTPEKRDVTIISGNVALEQLENILVTTNLIVIIISPVFAWYLTSKTLYPIERSSTAQKRFVSDASHEMRTPLSIISGELEVSLRKRRKNKEYKKTIESVREEIDKLSSLVSNLLFLSRGDDGRKSMSFAFVDVTDMLATIISKYTPKIKEKKISFKFIPPYRSVSIKGDEEMLVIAFGNLLENAIKYTPKKGKISLVAEIGKRHIYIRIKDNGKGIDKDDLGKIFNRFYRVEENSPDEKGFGLGLSLVKSVVEMHKGKISVVSEEGKGSTFIVSLPKAY
jgi:signal transduction histidine kinase